MSSVLSQRGSSNLGHPYAQSLQEMGGLSLSSTHLTLSCLCNLELCDSSPEGPPAAPLPSFLNSQVALLILGP